LNVNPSIAILKAFSLSEQRENLTTEKKKKPAMLTNLETGNPM
jgi:hypothetical protein